MQVDYDPEGSLMAASREVKAGLDGMRGSALSGFAGAVPLWGHFETGPEES